jgi:hypothetical protein
MDVPPGFLDAPLSYVGNSGQRSHDFMTAAEAEGDEHFLDVVSVASMLAFQYIVDGRTLLTDVRRIPWFDATAISAAKVGLSALDSYGRVIETPRRAAQELIRRLRRELETSFKRAQRVTILLSGGLDSRLSSAVLMGLARQGKVTDDIRAVSWGIPESRDRHYASQVARRLGIQWTPIDLRPTDLAANIRLSGLRLGAMVSPVHLHAIRAVSELDWHDADKILVSTLGNGVGRGTYLYRHVTYTRPVEPCDWLCLLRPNIRPYALAGLAHDLAEFRRRLRSRPRAAVHECEMLAHYLSGLLLPVFDLLRAKAPVHQAMADPDTYGFLWSLTPFLRSGSMYREAVRLSGEGMADVPYALTNRPLKRLARPQQNGLSPFLHRYPHWISHDLAGIVDEALNGDWFDATGVFDGAAIRRVWRGLRQQPNPQPQASYVLLWLCALRELMESLQIKAAGRQEMSGQPAARQGGCGGPGHPPWGFAGRPPASPWRRWTTVPEQCGAVLQCLVRGRP